jgi:hypothetical protein
MVRKIIQATLALLLALALGLLFVVITQAIIMSVAVGVISYLIIIFVLENYAKRRFHKAVKDAEAQKIQPKREA